MALYEHLNKGYTCSFWSISCFKEAERDSCASPFAADTAVFDDGRRTMPVEFRGDATRGETADRAVAPLVIEESGGVGDADTGRLDVDVARGGAVVAMSSKSLIGVTGNV